jgi:hypothetical protein
MMASETKINNRKPERFTLVKAQPKGTVQYGITEGKGENLVSTRAGVMLTSPSLKSPRKGRVRVVQKRARMGKGRGVGSISSLPPQLEASVAVSHVYRFQPTVGGLKPVTVGDLLGVCGGIATSTTSVTTWASSLKIAKVVIWPSEGGNPMLQWSAGQSGQMPDSEKFESIPTGITVTKALVFKPPAKSLASFWITSADASATLFEIRGDSGSIIDLHISYRLSNIFAPLAITVSAATAGDVYYLALDGHASNDYSPIGLPTI